jgi:hypothetical protein
MNTMPVCNLHTFILQSAYQNTITVLERCMPRSTLKFQRCHITGVDVSWENRLRELQNVVYRYLNTQICGLGVCDGKAKLAWTKKPGVESCCWGGGGGWSAAASRLALSLGDTMLVA